MPSSVDVSFAKKVLERKLVKKSVVIQCLNELKKLEAAGRPVTLVQLMLEKKIVTGNQVRALGFDAPASPGDFRDADSTDEIPVPGSDFAVEVPQAEADEEVPPPPPPPPAAPKPPTEDLWDAGAFSLEGEPGPAMEFTFEEESKSEPPPISVPAAEADEEGAIELVPDAGEEGQENAFLPELTLEAATEDEEFFEEKPEAGSDGDFQLELTSESSVNEMDETRAAPPPKPTPDAVPDFSVEEAEPEEVTGEEVEAAPVKPKDKGSSVNEYLPPLDLLGEIEERDQAGDASSATDEIPAVGSVNARETAMFPSLEQPSAEDGEAIPLPPEADKAEEQGGEFEGEPFGSYILGPILYKGLLGRVHRALNATTKQKILVEVAKRSELQWLAADLPERIATLMAASNLNHRNIAKLLASGWEGDEFYIALDLPNGHRLPEYMHDRVVLPTKEAVSFMYQCCSAFSAAEKKGILHEDIRPANMWVMGNGTIKVLNFGIPLEPCITGPYSSAMPMTLNRACFISPEVCEGKPVDVAAGIYALGVTFYYILTGRYPVMGETYISTAFKHLNGEFVNPKRYVSEIPDELVNIVCRMLAKRLDQRYQSFRQIIDDLEPFDIGREVTFARSLPQGNIILDEPEIGEPVFCIVRGRNRGVSFKVDDGKEISIGRDSSQSKLPILDGMVSRKHCIIQNRGGKYYCADAGSSNGTFVNHHKVKEPVKLRSGDRVRLGSTEVLFGLIPVSPDAFHFAQTATTLQLVSTAQAEECLLELGDRESRGKQLSVSRVMHLKGYMEVEQLNRVIATVDERLYAFDLQQRRLREQQASLLMSHPDKAILPDGSYIMRSLLEEFLFCESCGCLIYNEQISTGEAERCGSSVFCPACAVHSTFLGERIDHLLLLHLIGQGRLGSVYQAEESATELVAVKMIHHNFLDMPGLIDILRAKVDRLRDIHHPNIAEIVDIIKSGNTYAILMELAGRVSLDELLLPGVGESEKDLRPWSSARALEVIHQISLALACLHTQDIVHGELAPAKVLFNAQGIVKLVGAGVAASSLVPPENLGPSPAMFPPDNFTAPEVLRGAPPDAASDQFSLGAITWTMLMGKRFDARTAAQELTIKDSGLPRRVVELVARMIQLKPADRFPSMTECNDAIESLKMPHKS